MEVDRNQFNFEQKWLELRQGLDNLFTNDISTKENFHFDLYTIVFECCSESISGGVSSRHELYQRLTTFLREHIQTNYEKCENLINEPLLKLYVELWGKFLSASRKLNDIFYTLNEHWISHAKEKKQRLDVLEAYQLAMISWKNHLMEHLKNRLAGALLNLIEKERNGETVNTKLIKSSLNSYVETDINNVGIYSKGSTLGFYKEAFEKEFLAETESFYAKEAASFIRTNPVLEFLKKIEAWFNQEQRRAQLYLHESTLAPLVQILEHFLCSRFMDIILAEFKKLLKCNKTEDLKRMFQSLTCFTGAFDKLQFEFKSFVTTEGLLAMKICDSGAIDPKTYIDTILNVHQRFYCMVQTSFENEAGFNASFERACEEFINRNAVTKSSGTSNKSAELLARYIDALLQKNATGSEEEEKTEKLNRTMIIFKYIKEKDLFERYYRKMLVKRLVQQMNSPSNDDIEKSMISKMWDICGYKYVSKMQRIIQDNVISQDFNVKFREEKSLKIDFNIRVISSLSWPFRKQSGLMSLPQEIEQSVHEFTSFYNLRYNGRNLTWMYTVSRGELISRCFNKKYTFQATTFQMAVLLQFNNQITLPFHELEESTGINPDDLLQTLQVLARLNILKETNGNHINEVSSMSLNESYKNKKLKVVINAPMKSEVKREKESVEKHVKEERAILIQEAIKRIAKDRKVIKHQELLMEVRNQVSSDFIPSFPEVIKEIDVLIKEEYLKRDIEDVDTYCYIA